MRCIIVLVIALTTFTARTNAAAPTTPHGEAGKITRMDGVEYIAYSYVESPGAPGQPAMFKVFRPRADPPAGLPKPRLGPSDQGSWAFIGEGSQAYMSAMMDLDADGVVTWTFMSIDKLEQYRGAGGQTAAETAYGHDPNLPKEFDELGLAPNDFAAGGFTYAYRSGRDNVPELELIFLARATALQYLGYNEQGTWLAGDNTDNVRLYTFRGDVHVPFDCHSSAPCLSGGQLTRQPYSVALPKNLHNMPAAVREDLGRMPYGKGPGAAEEVAENARIHEIAEANKSTFTSSRQLLTALRWVDKAKIKPVDDAYSAWGKQVDKECGAAPAELAWALAHGPYVKTPDSVVACRTAKARERNALYEKAMVEVNAKNVSAETWRALGAP